MLPVSAPKRTRMVNLRLTPGEYDILQGEAERLNATVTQRDFASSD